MEKPEPTLLHCFICLLGRELQSNVFFSLYLKNYKQFLLFYSKNYKQRLLWPESSSLLDAATAAAFSAVCTVICEKKSCIRRQARYRLSSGPV